MTNENQYTECTMSYTLWTTLIIYPKSISAEWKEINAWNMALVFFHRLPSEQPLFIQSTSGGWFCIFISKYIASIAMFSLREFSFLYYLLKYKQIPSPKPFLSRRNIMYPFTENWFLGKKLSIFVYDVPSIKFFVVSNCSFWKNLCLDDLAFFRII